MQLYLQSRDQISWYLDSAIIAAFMLNVLFYLPLVGNICAALLDLTLRG